MSLRIKNYKAIEKMARENVLILERGDRRRDKEGRRRRGSEEWKERDNGKEGRDKGDKSVCGAEESE